MVFKEAGQTDVSVGRELKIAEISEEVNGQILKQRGNQFQIKPDIFVHHSLLGL